MPPAIAIQEILTRSVIGAGETSTMGQEFAWVEFVGRNWGLGAVVLGLFGWSAVRLAGWMGPRIDQFLQRHNALVDGLQVSTMKVMDGQSDIKQDVATIAKDVTTIKMHVRRNCARMEPPDSDTDIGKTSVHE